MAHLLLMYQYLRAKREVNELTAKAFKFSGKKDRIKKNIEKTQKYYTDAKAKIAAQVKRMTSAGSVFFQQQAGLGAGMMSNYINPYSTMSGNNAFISNAMIGMLGSDDFNKALNDENSKLGALTNEELADMYNKYNRGELKKGDDGNYSGYSEAQMNSFQALLSSAQQYQYQMQTWVNNANANFQQNISIWEEAMNAQLEAEQDAALEPLNYEETMMELEETTTKTKLEEKKQELDNIKQELSQRVKDDAVSFGLS